MSNIIAIAPFQDMAPALGAKSVNKRLISKLESQKRTGQIWVKIMVKSQISSLYIFDLQPGLQDPSKDALGYYSMLALLGVETSLIR